MSLMENINLYLDKTVLVTLEGGKVIAGILDVEGGKAFVDETNLGLDEIRDIRYCGKLDMDTYDIRLGRLTTPEGFLLSEEELIREVGEDYAFGEKLVEYQCHLVYDPESRRTCVRDMKVTRTCHAVNLALLEGRPFLYRMGGPYFYATLADGLLQTAGGSIPFDSEKITDITCCPEAGVEVTVILNDGQRIASTVSSATARGIVLAAGYVGRIAYADIRELRYQGKMHMRDKVGYCGEYRYRHRYLRQKTKYAFREGQMTDFSVGMTGRGLICKDVDLEPYDDNRSDYGILSEYLNVQSYGYVDQKYESGVQNERAYYLNGACLPKGLNNNDIDTHKFLYVVRIKHAPNVEYGNRIVTEMEILDQYDRGQYRLLSVDSQGNVHAEPFQTPVDMTGVVEEGYAFLYFYGKLKDGKKKVGKAYITKQVAGSDTKYDFFTYLSAYLAKYRGQEINTFDNVYLIRYWFDRSQQPDNGMLPTIYKIEILRELPRNRNYCVSEEGEVSDYDSKEFACLDDLRDERIVVICRDNNRYMGTLQSNDPKNSTLTLSFGDALGETIHYSRIEAVWGLGKVSKYEPDGSYGFIQAAGGIYFKNSAVQSEQEPKLQVGELVGFRMGLNPHGKNPASLVRPVVETVEEGYVVGREKNGTFAALGEKDYTSSLPWEVRPEPLGLQNPQLQLEALDSRDYRVQVRGIRFADGGLLLRGIEKLLGFQPRLRFGCVEKFCAKTPGKFTYGFLTPLAREDRKAMPDGVYFNIAQNRTMFEQVLAGGENPNKTELCLVSYQMGLDTNQNAPRAENMTFIARHPKSWFEQLLAKDAVSDPEVALQLQRMRAAGESLQSKIHFCLKQNNVDAAKKQLEDYARGSQYDENVYYQQLHSVLMKEYKLNHTQEVRRNWLDCIVKLRKAVDQTEQYGLRLDLLYKQANLTMEEDQVDGALRLYREWKQLLEELCAIYPNKKSSYQNFLVRVDRILGAQGHGADSVDLGSDENDLSGVEIHAYLEWRLDAADEKNDADALWVQARTERRQAAEERYIEALKAAVKAETRNIPDRHFRQKAHFAFLDLRLDPKSDDAALLAYFGDALRKDRTFAPLLGLEGTGVNPELPVKSCSQFTLDSLLLCTAGQMDPQPWLARFTDETLRQRYIRELSCLLAEKTDRFDMEQLEAVFAEAVAMLQQSVESGQHIDQYAAAVLRRVEQYRRCGVAVSQEVDLVLRDLRDYNSRKGFTAKVGCLRDNATKLQAYHQTIRKNPTVHDWNLLWPLCARLIGQIQRTWHTLCQIFVPSIEFGTLQAVREPDGMWKITVPLRNSRNAQKATNLKILGYEMDPDNPKNLIGDGIAHAFIIRCKPEDPEAEQMTLELKVAYQYTSDVQFRNDKYKLIDKKDMVCKTVSVSCAAGQRQELSLDILNSFGYDAKANIDTDSPAGKAVAEILKNRTGEIETIIGAVSTGEKGSRKLMRDGRWVALYGQWRVGKTTILHEVHRALRGEEFGGQAVTVYTQFGAGASFEAETVEKICDALESVKDPEIAQLWMDHLEEWEVRYGEVKTLRNLGRLVGRFHQKIAPKTIVLALDEFTSIYLAIKKGYVDSSFLRCFIEFIAQSGCIILTAGGEHTVSLMTDYDVNMMQKADCKLEVKYLSKEDTAKYVETVIGIPSYLGNQEQKAHTLNWIFELTQGNAFLLHKFCEALIRYVRQTRNLVLIDDITIQNTLDRIAYSVPTRPQNVIKDYFNSLFNPYNEQDGVTIDGFGGVKEMNLRILNGIVRHASADNHVCRRQALEQDFGEEERLDEYLNTLIGRSVVKDEKNNLSIPIDMYYEIQSRIDRKENVYEL